LRESVGSSERQEDATRRDATCERQRRRPASVRETRTLGVGRVYNITYSAGRAVD